MSMPDFLKMEMFEKYAPSTNEMFTRVPGGFIYGDMQGCCFIPFQTASSDLSNVAYKKTEAGKKQLTAKEIALMGGPIL